MGRLSLEMFLSADGDAESIQYRILSAVKAYREDFYRNRLYPGLAELIDVRESLLSVQKDLDGLAKRLPQQLTGIDIEKKKLVFEPRGLETADVRRVADVIAWGLPMIQDAIEEGRSTYEFVEEHVSIEEVGIIPMYRAEGYIFIPDHRSKVLHVIRYEVSLFVSGKEKYRALKTHVLRSFEEGRLVPTPETLKMQLIADHADLPNPATFQCVTELDFPFTETIFPVAKRKLMARVAA